MPGWRRSISCATIVGPRGICYRCFRAVPDGSLRPTLPLYELLQGMHNPTGLVSFDHTELDRCEWIGWGRKVGVRAKDSRPVALVYDRGPIPKHLAIEGKLWAELSPSCSAVCLVALRIGPV